MALTKCPECGKDVSDEATKCPHCGYLMRRRGPGLAIGCLGLIALIWVVGKLSDRPDEDAITPESALRARALAEMPPPAPAVPIESTTAHYRRLLPSFRYAPDRINDWGRFSHRALPTTMWRRGLSLEVFPDGEVVLLSSYTGDDWLFHTSVTVRAGDRTATTQIVETHDPQHYTEVSGGTIAEHIRFTGGRGREVIDLLRDSTTKRAIVRFNGRQYYNDATMTEGQLRAFRETLRFAELQSTMNGSVGGRWRDLVPGAAVK